MTSKFLIHQSNFNHTVYPFVLLNLRASQVALVVKNMPANARDIREPGLIPGQEDPLEESMAPHSGVGGVIPTPRNEREEAEIILDPTFKVV